MEDTHLDEFAAEEEPVAAPPRAQPSPATSEPVRIVITEEQLASSWEMLPSEGPADPPLDGMFDAPFLQEADDDYRAIEPSMVESSTESIPLHDEVRRRSVIPVAIVVTLAMVLIGGRTMMKQFRTAPSVTETPAATERTTTSSPATNRAAETPADAVAADPGDATPAASETTTAVDTGGAATKTAAATIVPTSRPGGIETPAGLKAPARPQTLARVDPPARVERPARPDTGARIAESRNVPARPATASPSAAAPATLTKSTSTALSANVPASGEQPRAAEPSAAARPPQPEAERAAAVPVTPVVSPPPPPAAAASALAPETRAVLITLYKYQEAFSNLDSSAAHDIWPSVDVKALDRAFAQLDQQTVDLTGCNVGVNGDRAEAACTGTASYVQKVGKKAMRSEQRQWHFTLQQSEGQWVIDRVDARATQ